MGLNEDKAKERGRVHPMDKNLKGEDTVNGPAREKFTAPTGTQ